MENLNLKFAVSWDLLEILKLANRLLNISYQVEKTYLAYRGIILGNIDCFLVADVLSQIASCNFYNVTSFVYNRSRSVRLPLTLGIYFQVGVMSLVSESACSLQKVS